MEKEISRATLKRLPTYLAYLKAMDTRDGASFAIGRAAERKLDEEAARMAAPAEDAFEKEDGHAEN